MTKNENGVIANPGRLGNVEDVANAVVFLAVTKPAILPARPFISMVVGGGYVCWGKKHWSLVC